MSAPKNTQTPQTSILKKVLREVLPFRKYFILAVVLAVVVSLMAPIRPYFIQYIIDHDIAENATANLPVHCLWLFGLLLVESILRYCFVYITAWFSQNIVHDLRTRVFDKLIHMQVQFFDQNKIGMLTTRTINDVETINEVYSENFFTIISDFLTIVFVLGIMFYTDVKVTLISLATLPFLYLATYIFKEKVKSVNQKIRDKISEFNGFTQEHLSGIKLVKSFNAETKELDKFKKINREYTGFNIQAIWYYSWFFPVLETLIAISIGLVVGSVSLFGFSDSHYSAGMISAFILYLNMLFRPMRFLADKFNQLQMGFVACDRVFRLLEEPSKEPKGGENIEQIEGNIAFKNVYFQYLEHVPVLKDLSFDIEAGKTLAIVGATGSGKSSIINILNRFYPIDRGEILIDGINIDKISVQSLRSKIGIVLQDVFLFSGSLLDNIRLNIAGFTEEDAMLLAEELEIDDFFKQLPGGFNYEIIERGNSLSHGQRQIISFFRAIAKNPSVLILDEATSSIDSNTEYYIQKLIPKIIKNKTSIIIAHRLSTIVNADKILVLNAGEIVGQGTHTELLKDNPHYQKYFRELEVEN